MSSPVIFKNGQRRVCCVVPGCMRTAPYGAHDHASEVLCGPHYRLADQHLRRLRSRIKRRARHYGLTQARALADWALWNRIKRQSIERAMGI